MKKFGKKQPVKGKISKKDREFFTEHGHLPSDIVEDEFVIDSGLVIDEADLDRMQKRQKVEKNHENHDQDLGNEDEDTDGNELENFIKRASPYQLLLQSLRKTSENPKLFLESGDEEEDSEQEGESEDSNGDFSSVYSEQSVEDSNQDETDDDFYVKHEFDNEEEHFDDTESITEKLTADDDEEEADDLKDAFFEHFKSERSHELESRLLDPRNLVSLMEDEDFGKVSVTAQIQMKKLPIIAFEHLNIKKRLLDNWNSINPNSKTSNFQKKLFTHLSSYKDLVFTSRTFENGPEIIQCYVFHALNHIYKSNDRVMKNNEKMKKSNGLEDKEYRDQGFTRPKVLILLPLRNMAFEVIQTLINLSQTEQQENKKRFMDDFGPGEFEPDSKKPEDYQRLFNGNFDDCFRIGIKLARKSMRLYSEFYSSDIIVASPLGLRMVVGAEGDKKRDFDFLSSIEVVISDMSHVMMMQNWDHVSHIFKHLNLIPKESHGCDFSRVKQWYLDANVRAKNIRQSVVFSAYATPDLNSLVKNHFCNVEGKLRNKKLEEASISKVIPQVQHIFNRFDVKSMMEVDEKRFEYFTKKIFPALVGSTILQNHTCIFVPSYFDFLKVRKWFQDQELSFTCLSEYSSTPDISRARTTFFHGKKHFLLITERFHFFRRYRIRGIKNLIFYGPPQNAEFYSEVVNMLSSGTGEESLANETGATVALLYSKFDMLALERIIGESRVEKLIDGEKGVYMFA